MKNNSVAPLVGMLVLTLAVVCTGRSLHTANLFLPHVTVAHTAAAPDNGDKPFSAIDSIYGPGYTGYLSSSDRVKYFQQLIKPNLECDGKSGCSFRVCTIENVEAECEQCSDVCIRVLHASICMGHKKVCKTSTCTRSKQVCRSPGDISGGIKAAGVPIKVWLHVPVDGSNTPYWDVTEGRLQQMLVEANTLIGRAGFKLVLGDVNFFPASKEDMTARGGPSNGGFTMRQAQLMGDRRKGGFSDLNVWLADQHGQHWGGFGLFPHLTTTGQVNACNDGIVLLATDLNAPPPGRIPGTLLAHEMGHWLQLPHTFREDEKSQAIAQALNNKANIPQAKQAVASGELCAVDNDSGRLRALLPQLVTGRDGFESDAPLSTPHQPLMHSDPAVLALPGWEGFKSASHEDSAVMANYKALGCGGVGASKTVKSCFNQDRPDDYTNIMDYMPDACRAVYTAQQIAVMHTAYRVRQEISINGKTDKYLGMQASRCLTGA